MTAPAVNPSIADLLAGLTELAQADFEQYQDADRYFENSAPEFFADKRIARRIGEGSKKFRVNITKKPVTSVTDRLKIASVSVEGDKKATAKLAEIMESNELWLEAPIIHLRACEFGDEYVFLSENDDDGVEIERAGARSTRIIYDPERPRRPKYGIKTFEVGSGEHKRTRVNLYYPEDAEDGTPARIERWISARGVERSTDPEHWEPYTRQDDDGEEVVPHTEELKRFPLYHFRTDRPYGKPLHADSYGAQDAMNKLIVTMMSTVDQQGWPTRYALAAGGNSEGDDDTDDFGALDDPDETGVVDAVDADSLRKRGDTSKLQSGPGAVWWLEGAKGAGEFKAADPKVFLTPADWFVRMAAQATDTPLHMYDPGGDQPSGDSRRAALSTLKERVGFVARSFASTWRTLLSDALADVGMPGLKVHVEWAPFDAVDDAEGWETVKAKIDAGVPVGQALTEAGYSATMVAEWLANSDEQDLRRKVELLAELAKAMRDLGTGVGMGVVPAELVQQVLAGFLPAPEEEDATE